MIDHSLHPSATRGLVFRSQLGWMAARWHDDRLAALAFGHPNEAAALAWLAENARASNPRGTSVLEDCWTWTEEGEPVPLEAQRSDASPATSPAISEEMRTLVTRLRAYAAGEPDELRDIELEEAHLTPFRQRVTQACRAIPYGKTMTYAQLAEQVGAPRGARAVGNVMRTNPWPLIVPCHRVVGSAGGLGGYSAPEGLSMKKRLLAMEAAAAAHLV